MKSAVLLVLLSLSLGANVWLALGDKAGAPLGLGSQRNSSLSSTQPQSQAEAGGQRSAATGAAVERGAATGAQADGTGGAPVVWQVANTEAEYKAFVEKMKAAGFPIRVIRSMLQAMLRQKAEAESPSEVRPYWQRTTPTKEEVAQRNARSRAEQELIESVLGADGRPSALMTAEQRERSFGPLSNDKIDALLKIERDYSEIRSSTYPRQGTTTPEEYRAMQEQRALVDKEKLADIAALLTPAELEAYQMRTSEASYKVSRALQDLTVTEAEFKRLYQMQKAFDEANPSLSGNISSETWSRRLNAQLAYNEQLRGALGEERFYNYVASSDQQYAMLARSLAQYPSVTPAATYQVYQMQAQMRNEMSQNKQRPDLESYNARLETLLGAEAAAAFRKTPAGRMYTLPTGSTTTVIRTGTGG